MGNGQLRRKVMCQQVFAFRRDDHSVPSLVLKALSLDFLDVRACCGTEYQYQAAAHRRLDLESLEVRTRGEPACY